METVIGYRFYKSFVQHRVFYVPVDAVNVITEVVRVPRGGVRV